MLEPRRLIRIIHMVLEVCLFLGICQAHGAKNLEELWPRELWLAFGLVAPNEPELPRETVWKLPIDPQLEFYEPTNRSEEALSLSLQAHTRTAETSKLGGRLPSLQEYFLSRTCLYSPKEAWMCEATKETERQGPTGFQITMKILGIIQPLAISWERR